MDNIDIAFVADCMFFELGVPIYVYKDNHIMYKITSFEDKMDVVETDIEIYNQMIIRWEKQKMPVMYEEDVNISYAGFSDNENNFYLIGPYTNDSLNPFQTNEYQKKHGNTTKNYRVVKIIPERVANVLSNQFYLITGKKAKRNEILSGNCNIDKISDYETIDYEINKEMNRQPHITYEQERNFFESILNGDIEKISSPHIGYDKEGVGKLAKKSMKQMEYTAVCLIALITREAINTGMNSNEAYDLSDLYLQRLENSCSVNTILNLMDVILKDFTLRIKKIHEEGKKDGDIEFCRNYIAQNYHKPIRIEDISKKLKMNRSYLSKKFTEQIGISMKEYMIKTKINVAANLLKYSEASIAEISEYLCFNNQSQFGLHFKNQFDMTPMKYRQVNKSILFKS